MAVSPSHFFGLVTHHRVDIILPGPCGSVVRGERVAEDMESPNHFPFAPCQRLFEVIRCLIGR